MNHGAAPVKFDVTVVKPAYSCVFNGVAGGTVNNALHIAKGPNSGDIWLLVRDPSLPAALISLIDQLSSAWKKEEDIEGAIMLCVGAIHMLLHVSLSAKFCLDSGCPD
jgi:hypothetical protein